MDSGIKWIVADEAILFRSLKKKRRDTTLLYQPHAIEKKGNSLAIVFRDRNLSDLIGFSYHNYDARIAVEDFMKHLKDIADYLSGKDILVTVAMDGENAWEYFPNDGHDFLELLYSRISESNFVKAVTVKEYLEAHPPESKIKHLAAGSWIYGNFNKWMDNPYKAKAWDWLSQARKELEETVKAPNYQLNEKIWKQIYIIEGSDWFWWYGEDPNGDFDKLFRMHLTNFYTLLSKDPPGYLKEPLTIDRQ
jgi:alpha-amylase/alpha-mannosidase (GH57 family)